MLFIACPSYKHEHPAHAASREATLAFFGGRAVYHRLPGDSCLARARATLLGVALQRERPWTHLLQVDDDQSWDPRVLAHLVELDHPIVGLPCAYKVDPPDPRAGLSTVRGIRGETVAEDGTVRVKYLGGGFILWRFDVLEALCAAHPEDRFVTNDTANAGLETWALWTGGVADGEFLTEDYWICQRAAALGYEPRCHLKACSPHWQGNTPYLPKGFEMEKAA